MAIEVTLEGRFEEENDFEGYMNFIQETAIKNQLNMEIYEDCAVIDVCPEGYIEISCEILLPPYIASSTISNEIMSSLIAAILSGSLTLTKKALCRGLFSPS